MTRITLIFLCILLSCSQNEKIEFSGEAIGTTYNIKIVNTKNAEYDKAALLNIIDAEIDKLNLQMSTYLDSSEISIFNKSGIKDTTIVSQEFLDVLNLARQIWAESSGAFDATVAPAVDLWGFGKKGRISEPPKESEIKLVHQAVGMQNIDVQGNKLSKKYSNTELDFSAIAKGFIVDAVAKVINEQGFDNYLVEIGGEVVVKGQNAEEKAWGIGVDRPLIEQSVNRGFEAIVDLSDAALATSGDYRNYFISDDSLYSHTIDPLTCRPIINGVASVTVIAENCALADAMATAIMVMGAENGLEWIESKPGVEAMIILRNEKNFEILQSSGFNKFVRS